ncbi:MAG: ATPase, T2SS/T4P/T4SS family, partial [Pseudomonadota bacterium]
MNWPLMQVAEMAALPAPPEKGAPQIAFLNNRPLAVARLDGGLFAALADPFDDSLRQAVELAADGPVTFGVCTEAGVEAWRMAVRRPASVTAQPTDEATGLAVEALDSLLEQAARRGASDMHLEPSAKGGRARARIDGEMREIGTLDASVYPAAIARAKVLARMDVAERRLPQDGRARMALARRDVDLRLSTAPALQGESLAVRLLDPAGAPGDLSALGFDDAFVATLREAASRPHGLFLLTGPTGSGKTTTLHAVLSELNTTARKIMTIEDPVEYALPGVVQMQVRPEIGFDFA